MSKIVCALMLMSCLSLVFASANAADYTLDIFGNANMDDVIDEADVEYVTGIIGGTNKETELADANYDGKVDKSDITQIELIIRGEDEKLTLIDDSGKIVTVTKPIDKLIPLSCIDSVRALDARDKIVGVPESITTNPELYPDLSQKPNIGSSSEISIEKIVSLDPDIVIASASTSPEILDDHLGGTDIQVIRIYPRNFEETSTFQNNLSVKWASLPEDMLKLGYVIGKIDAAKNYVEWYEGIVNPIVERVSKIPDKDKPKVFTEDDSRGGMIERTSSGHIMGVEAAGGNRIGPGRYHETDRVVSVEWIIRENPDVYVARLGTVPTGGYQSDDGTDYKAYYDEIMGLSGFENTNAAKNNRVHIVSGELTLKSALPVGIAYQAKWYNPEVFADLDPEALHQEYIDRFCPGLKFDVSKHGVFIYPSE